LWRAKTAGLNFRSGLRPKENGRMELPAFITCAANLSFQMPSAGIGAQGWSDWLSVSSQRRDLLEGVVVWRTNWKNARASDLVSDKDGTITGQMAVIRLERNVFCGVLEAGAMVADEVEVRDVSNAQVSSDLCHLPVEIFVVGDAMSRRKSRIVLLN